jgi:FMN-dependent oxidoreductase (nitrilotriacetate monooxygenase family)
MHLNLFILGHGHHEASSRHPGASPLALTDLRYYQDLVQRGEAALFDSVFLADGLIMAGDFSGGARGGLEPLTLLAALAATTSRIGLIATASTTYTEPFNLARQFASLDHLSNGRIAWNIVTSSVTATAQNFGGAEGGAEPPSHADRYKRAEEYMTVVRGLWDGWAEDANLDLRRNAEAPKGVDRIRALDHEGDHYTVAGPLNIPRGPQGRPVLVQAGSSEDGRGLAARHADAIFTAHLEKSSAQEFYGDIKKRVKAEGRDPDQVLILPGLSPVIGSTEAEARRMSDELNALADPDVGLRRLSARFNGKDFSHLPLDERVTLDDFPDPSTVEGSRSRTEVILGIVRREQPTMRRLLAVLAGARGHYVMAGTPDQVADLMEDWFNDGAADGFNVMPPVLPSMLDVFSAEVIPLLQQRGLFRTAYEGEMLRDHYNLAQPVSQFD